MRILPVLFVVLAVSAAACLEPTQIEMTVRTDVPYAPGRSVAIAVAKSGMTDATEPATTAEEPWGADGAIGSVVLLPSDDRDEPISVRVVMGLGRDPATCTTAEPTGCIFARRRLSFVPHEPLVLPVTLYAACAGVPCDENSTCTALGTCVPSTIDPSDCADGKSCELGTAESPPSASSSSGDATTSTSSGGGSSSTSSGGSTSSSGAAPQCDPTDVVVPPAGFFSFGTVNNSATINSGDPFGITIAAAGEEATFTRALATPDARCPLHFAMDLESLRIDQANGNVTLMTLGRGGAGGDLVLEASALSASTFGMSFKGSNNVYLWNAPHAGVVEIVLPLDPMQGPPAILVNGVRTDFVSMPSSILVVQNVTLQFGLGGAPSRVGYRSAHYFFAP